MWEKEITLPNGVILKNWKIKCVTWNPETNKISVEVDAFIDGATDKYETQYFNLDGTGTQLYADVFEYILNAVKAKQESDLGE